MKKNTSNSNKNCYILGIHDGHNCGAALSLNGKIIASISEERLTRKKNDVGYPKKSINECLKLAGIDSTNLSDIVFASNFMHEPSFLKDITPWYLVGKIDQDALVVNVQSPARSRCNRLATFRDYGPRTRKKGRSRRTPPSVDCLFYLNP